jgi:hypothetical protein
MKPLSNLDADGRHLSFRQHPSPEWICLRQGPPNIKRGDSSVISCRMVSRPGWKDSPSIEPTVWVAAAQWVLCHLVTTWALAYASRKYQSLAQGASISATQLARPHEQRSVFVSYDAHSTGGSLWLSSYMASQRITHAIRVRTGLVCFTHGIPADLACYTGPSGSRVALPAKLVAPPDSVVAT